MKYAFWDFSRVMLILQLQATAQSQNTSSSGQFAKQNANAASMEPAQPLPQLLQQQTQP